MCNLDVKQTNKQPLNVIHSLQMFFSVPVYGVWHIDVPGRKLKDLPGGTHPAVWVRLNLQEVRGQAVVGVLRSWRNVQLQLGCGECVSSQRKGKGVLKKEQRIIFRFQIRTIKGKHKFHF